VQYKIKYSLKLLRSLYTTQTPDSRTFVARKNSKHRRWDRTSF